MSRLYASGVTILLKFAVVPLGIEALFCELRQVSQLHEFIHPLDEYTVWFMKWIAVTSYTVYLTKLLSSS